MKHLSLLILLIATTIPASAQLTRLHNAPRGGDEIIRQRVDYKDPGRGGENVIWDFGQLMSIDPEYRLIYSDIPPVNDTAYLVLRDSIPAVEITEGELMKGVEHYTAYYYRVMNDTLFILGHENPVVLMRHNPPLLSMPFPFGYGQQTERDYRSRGFYSSKEPVMTEGNMVIEADAYGRMVLPSGDTLDHVLRIKTLQTIADADTSRAEDEHRLKMETETFRWFVKGYRYPVFETARTFDVSDTATTEIFATAFFYPPQEHLYLEADSANLAVLDSLWNIGGTGNPNHGNGEGSGDTPLPDLNLVHNHYPNPVRDILYIEYYFEADASVTVALFDMGGMAVRNIPQRELRKGMHRDELDCTGLPAGSYVLQLKVRDETVNGVVVKR